MVGKQKGEAEEEVRLLRAGSKRASESYWNTADGLQARLTVSRGACFSEEACERQVCETYRT